MTLQRSGNVAKIQENCMRWVKGLVAAAWALALISSIMQLLVWGTIEPDPVNSPGWEQCTTIWFIARYKHNEVVELRN